MIDKKLEPYYDALFSIFLGVIIVLFLHNMYDSPRSIVLDSTEAFKSGCSNLNVSI